MEITMLVLVFLCALAVSAGVVLAFSIPIDGALARVLSPEMAMPWSKYAKFALFVASLTGGLRLQELSALTPLGAAAANGQGAITVSRCLIEVYKTIVGTLGLASWTLLAFFGATLIAYLAISGFESMKPGSKTARSEERHMGVPSGRL